MLTNFIKKNYTNDQKKLRNFGLLMAIAISVLFGIILPLIAGNSFPWSPWIISVVLLVVALIKPRLLICIHLPWVAIGEILGRINTLIILTLIYYILFTPLAVMMKLMKQDPLKRKINRRANTYRVLSANKDYIKNMENPY